MRRTVRTPQKVEESVAREYWYGNRISTQQTAVQPDSVSNFNRILMLHGFCRGLGKTPRPGSGRLPDLRSSAAAVRSAAPAAAADPRCGWLAGWLWSWRLWRLEFDSLLLIFGIPAFHPCFKNGKPLLHKTSYLCFTKLRTSASPLLHLCFKSGKSLLHKTSYLCFTCASPVLQKWQICASHFGRNLQIPASHFWPKLANPCFTFWPKLANPCFTFCKMAIRGKIKTTQSSQTV